MRAFENDIREIVGRHGVLVRQQYPNLAPAVDWQIRQGRLRPVLPGVYAPTASVDDLSVRVRALMLSEPECVLTGATAARFSFWPGIRCDVVQASTRRQRASRPGFAFSRSVVPPELIRERAPLRFTAPALTALDLCEVVGGDGIDQALRTRTATLRGLWRAFELTPNRPGNRRRRELLIDSRDKPWSAAERRGHRLLRSARISGWESNHPVVLDGHLYYLDVAFPKLRLVIEIDGRLHEDDPEVFENDRWRQNALVLDGWTVLRFTWRMLEDEPEAFVAAVVRALVQVGAR